MGLLVKRESRVAIDIWQSEPKGERRLPPSTPIKSVLAIRKNSLTTDSKTRGLEVAVEDVAPVEHARRGDSAHYKYLPAARPCRVA